MSQKERKRGEAGRAEGILPLVVINIMIDDDEVKSKTKYFLSGKNPILVCEN